MTPYKGFMIPSWEDIIVSPSRGLPAVWIGIRVPSIDGTLSLVLQINKEDVVKLPQDEGDKLLEKEAKDAVDRWIEAANSLNEQ